MRVTFACSTFLKPRSGFTSEWFDRWFDGEDTRQPDEHGLCGVIHFLADPEHEGNATILQVDFGSAPEEAFEELLDALRDSGVTKIEIGA